MHFLPGSVKFLQYFFSACNVVSLILCVSPSPIRYIWFVLLVACALKLMSAPKINTFLPFAVWARPSSVIV